MASSSSSSSNKITLESSDGETFEVDVSVVAKWKAIKNTVKKAKTKTRVKPITMKGVTRDTLTKIIQYSEKHAQAEASASDGINDSDSGGVDDNLEPWDTQFFKAMSLEELNGVTLAAKSVGYEKLVDAGCERVKDIVDALTQGLYDVLSILHHDDSEKKKRNKKQKKK
ncbi:hypothetical protein FNV43_RR21878 [Rhamnella rubrinervis]|uniref:SKP1-like protein n=1 Tax=Rhamnella rubrinervis TaxID=2594499 RepID=A0A8K0DP70_9ROSA|nr:hypothetical protein FNV43_RR21878 [Rhamnella rubrinervis]